MHTIEKVSSTFGSSLKTQKNTHQRTMFKFF